MQTRPRLGLIEQFKDLPDPRLLGRCDHDRIEALLMAPCCLLCGGERFNDLAHFGHANHDCFKAFLRLPPARPATTPSAASSVP